MAGPTFGGSSVPHPIIVALIELADRALVPGGAFHRRAERAEGRVGYHELGRGARFRSTDRIHILKEQL